MRLKSKFSLLITTLIITVIGLTFWLIVNQARSTMMTDIYQNTRSFAQLTADDVVELATTYLPEQSFVVFNPLISDLLAQNEQISNLQVHSYAGELVYDRNSELIQQYQGAVRISDTTLKERVQSQYASLITEENNTYYWQSTGKEGELVFTDRMGVALPMQPDFTKTQIKNLIIPVNNSAAVFYEVSYEQLNTQLKTLTYMAGLLAILASLISIAIGLGFTGAITRNLQHLTEVVRKIATGDLKQRSSANSKDEVGELSTAINQMTDDLEKSMAARIFQEKTEKELELAAKIQQELLPTSIPETEGADLFATLQPAGKISGDIYDFIEIKTETEHAIYMYLADVTGHGISASLLSTTLNATISLVARLTPDPVKLLSEINKTLKAKTAANVFVTLAFLKYDLKAKTVTLVNCGHEQPIIYRAATKSAEILPPGGIAIGMIDDIESLLKPEIIDLSAGDVVVLYSDGYPEAWQSETENLTLAKLQNLIAQNGSLSTAREIALAIQADVNQYRAGYEQKDDMTILTLLKK